MISTAYPSRRTVGLLIAFLFSACCNLRTGYGYALPNERFTPRSLRSHTKNLSAFRIRGGASILGSSDGGSKTSMKLSQYSSDAASLFNNMVTPASIIAGAIVPIGFVAPLPLKPENREQENWFAILLRRLYLFVSVFSICSELSSAVWATIAVNKLTEAEIDPAKSVWDLIERDFELHWTAVNSHFVIGLLGFMWMIGTRVYLTSLAEIKDPVGSTLGMSAAGMAISGLLLAVSIVNRGVAWGSGRGDRYGLTVFALIGRYAQLLMRQATSAKSFGPLQLISILLALISTVTGAWALVRDAAKNKS